MVPDLRGLRDDGEGGPKPALPPAGSIDALLGNTKPVAGKDFCRHLKTVQAEDLIRGYPVAPGDNPDIFPRSHDVVGCGMFPGAVS